MVHTIVCIVPGFTEGHGTSRELRKLLVEQGFTISKKPEQADIVIAHSGGCFVIPEQATPKLTILINVPYWPRKYTAVSICEKITTTFIESLSRHTLRQWLMKLYQGSMYGMRMRHNLEMLIGTKQGTLWKRTDLHTIVIRNMQDMFCTPDLKILPFATKPLFLELPGSHDDCWDNPKAYAAIIQKYHEQYVLAKTV